MVLFSRVRFDSLSRLEKRLSDPAVDLNNLRNRLGGFHPPQFFKRLNSTEVASLHHAANQHPYRPQPDEESAGRVSKISPQLSGQCGGPTSSVSGCWPEATRML